ncbi:unnamed protein product, partial [Vitis vinifera]
MNQHTPAPNTPDPGTRIVTKQATLLRQPRRTNPMVWCCAILCLIFSLILIFFGIATLIIFLVIKPKTPLFDIPGVSLSSVYFDSPEYFNGDFTFLANFSNPNRKINFILYQAWFPCPQIWANLGLTHFSYWLHGRCQLDMTGPPTGVLVTRSCRTKR